MKKLNGFLMAALVLMAGCSSSNNPDTLLCKTHEDCTGELNRCAPTGACVACLETTDCAEGMVCSDHACVAPALCTEDDDCQGALKRCREDGVCVACLETTDCAEGQICSDHACVAPPCSLCSASEFCGADQRCYAKPTECTLSATSCAETEICVKTGTSSFCFGRCDLSQNEPGTLLNPDCYDGAGKCIYMTSAPTVGFCTAVGTPLAEGAKCPTIAPGTTAYSECGEGFGCIGHSEIGFTCQRECDPAQGIDTNPICGGNACDPLTGSTTLGVCSDRPATRELGEGCNATSASSPDYPSCANQVPCTEMLDRPRCLPACGAGRSCPSDFVCETWTNVCLPPSTNTQEPGEECAGSNPDDPTWNHCVDLSLCLATRGGEPTCSPYQTQTQPLFGECSNGYDVTKPEYNACLPGLRCTFMFDNGYCLETCEYGASPTTCEAGFVCVNAQSKGGVCAKVCSSNADCDFGKCREFSGGEKYCF